MDNEIFGTDKVLEKIKEVEFDGTTYKIREMTLKHYLEFLDGRYETLTSIIELVNYCCSLSLRVAKLDDNGCMLVYFLFSAILDAQKPTDEVKESDYNYQIDYSYNVAKIMRYYNYKLNELYSMPHSVFMTLLNHLKILECEEDRRTMTISTAVESRGIKNSNVYSSFISNLNKTISTVINFRKTEKANLKAWRQYIGTASIKERLKEDESEVK